MALPHESITQVADGSQITRHLWNTPNEELLDNDKYLDLAKFDKTGGEVTGDILLPYNTNPPDNAAVTKKWLANQLALNGIVNQEQRLYAIAAVVGKTLLPAALGLRLVGRTGEVLSDGLIACNAHGLTVGDTISFTEDSDAGYKLGVIYHVVTASTDSFRVGLTAGGAPLWQAASDNDLRFYKCSTTKYRWASSAAAADQYSTDGWPLCVGDSLVVFSCQNYSGMRVEGMFYVENLQYCSALQTYPDTDKFVTTLAPVEGLDQTAAYQAHILNGQIYKNAKMSISPETLGATYYWMTMPQANDYYPFDETLEPVTTIALITEPFNWDKTGEHGHFHYCSEDLSLVKFDGVTLDPTDSVIVQNGSVFSHAAFKEIGPYGFLPCHVTKGSNVITLKNHGFAANTMVRFGATKHGFFIETDYQLEVLTDDTFLVKIAPEGTYYPVDATGTGVQFIKRTAQAMPGYPVVFDLYRPPVSQAKRYRCDISSGNTHGGRTWRISPAYRSTGSDIVMSGIRYEYFALTAAI